MKKEYKQYDPNFIVNQIVNKGLIHKKSRTSIMIPCHYHANDTDPSLSINIDPHKGVPVGFFRCFGCGEKGGWYKLADKYGLATDNRDQFAYPASDSLLNNIITLKKLLAIFKVEKYKSNSDYRGIRHSLISITGGLSVKNKYGKYILFPVYNRNKIVGGILCDKNKDAKMKYLFMPNDYNPQWKSKFGLFNLNNIIGNTVVITEGVRDCLVLVDKGFPSVSILGCELSYPHVMLLRKHGIKNIVLVLDGDLAGYQGTKKARGILDKLNFNYADLKLYNYYKGTDGEIKKGIKAKSGQIKKDYDPADMPEYFYRKLNNIIKRIK
jgi:hypothetical protein